MVLVKYFGFAETVRIVLACKSLGDHCFDNSKLRRIVFGDGSQLTQIGAYTFYTCLSLRSICIPAGIESLGESCFNNCRALAQLTFEPGSRLSQIGASAFERCWALKPICIPAQVETIPERCFYYAKSLTALLFEERSELTRICSTAFDLCYFLRLIRIPAQLEVIDLAAFAECRSLSQLIFERPSRVMELDLPPREFGSLCIPDSVEILTGLIGSSTEQNRILQFSGQSRLREIHLNLIVCRIKSVHHFQTANTVFVSLPEELLRRFRAEFESW
jgi:hypothetical protein